MLSDTMCCGIARHDLFVRVDSETCEKTPTKPHSRPIDFTGPPLRRMVYVDTESYRAGEELKHWLDQALSFALSLPPKTLQANATVES